MKHARARVASMAFVLALGACDGGGVMWNSAMDELRGAPSAARLSESAHFAQDGIAFDYPAVLRLREETDDDGREWNFEYGLYTLELYAPRHAITAEAYLGALGEVLGGGRSIDARALEAGTPVTLCGAPRTPWRIDVKLMGDWSRLEAFDLPAPRGESRLLIFDDELPTPAGTPLGRATRERVLATLACAD